MMENLLCLDGGKMITDVENDHGETPLHFALVLFNRGHVAKVLLRHGASRISR